jgi:hypothetical protein
VVQIKGSKRLTHLQEATLDISAKEAMKNFKRSFTGLDWDYMNIPKYGQVLCDVGITIQPDHPKEELVGLWRLDCLEASYGAGGYLTGQIHTLNTLSMYGGLQAESPSWRSKEMHIRFRSSYNLAYEATRQHDNSRNLFEEKEVFNRGPWFQHELKSIKDIYEEKASEQSYGVRDEFRISGQAVNELIKCVDDSVRIYLCVFREIDRLTGFKQVLDFQATEPVLWIPSKLWFAFLSRHLTILNKTHERIYRIQPPNYGVISGLFAYLMQSVIFTSPKVNAYVRESLAVLQYQQHCNTFGMFFLDTFDLNNAACLIAEILPEDDASVHRILGPLVQKPRLPIAR